MAKNKSVKVRKGYDERGRRVFRDSDGKTKRLFFEILMLILILGPVLIAVYTKLR